MDDVSNKIEYTGLCVNCIHRDTCTFPKCDEGRLHCEEYECG